MNLDPNPRRKPDKRNPREIEIEKYLVRQCLMRKWDCWKLVSPGRRGVPDRIVLAEEGVMAMVECKRPSGGKISTLQARTINRLTEKGFSMYVVMNYDDVDRFINYIEAKVAGYALLS